MSSQNTEAYYGETINGTVISSNSSNATANDDAYYDDESAGGSADSESADGNSTDFYYYDENEAVNFSPDGYSPDNE